MKQSLSTIKNWFRTALKPTQAQFWDTWDSFWHKDDLIPVESVDGLDDALSRLPTPEQLAALAAVAPTVVNVAGSATLSVVAGKLVETVIAEGSAGTAKIGLSAGGNDIVESSVGPGAPLVARVDVYAIGAITLHFTGNFTAKIYLR